MCYDLPKSGEIHIDENSQRTVSQRIRTNNKIPAIANIHNLACGGAIRERCTAEQVVAFQKEHPLVDDAVHVCRTMSSNGKGLTQKAACMHAALCALENGVPYATLQKFMASVNTGFVDSQDQYSAIVLRNMLLNFRTGLRSGDVEMSFATQEAIFDYVNARPRRRRYTSTSGVYMHNF